MKIDYMNLPLLPEEKLKLISFTANNINYGIDIMNVSEVINPIELLDVPTLPQYVIGVADHRKNVVPIKNIQKRFNIVETKKTTKTKWLILKTKISDVGLQVDSVNHVVSVDESKKRDQLQLESKDKQPWIKDVYQLETGLIFELDIDVLINMDELEKKQKD